ncbi:peptidyl-prolyl cis-trans isomerase [Thermodesulfobacteriota bacterium]
MNKSALVLSFVSICLALAVVAIGYRITGMPRPGGAGPAAWSPEDQRSLAGKLKGAGLTLEAVREYEAYINTAALDKKTLASLSYSIGKMYLDAGKYERALAWLYVEIADPQTKLKAEVGSKIVHCLERTGKFNAAEYALNKRAAREQPQRAEGSVVVAEVSGEKIYREDVNEALDALPEWMRTQFDGDAKKAEFLKKYVADELFRRKAVKLEYDQDPEVRRRLAQVEKELLVNKVLEDELKDTITMAPEDLQNYFEAHKSEYARKEAVRLRLIKAGMQEIADNVIKTLAGGKDFSELAREISLDNATAEKGGAFKRWVRKGMDDLGIGNVEVVSRALFAARKGEVTPAVEAGGYYYIFKIDEHRPAKMRPFEEVAERVKNDYYMQKVQRSYQGLLEQVLKSAEVKLYPEKMTGGAAQ